MRTASWIVASIAIVGAVTAAAPAKADDDDNGWRRHEWREHEWREHHWGYAPPAVVYTAPPVPYYAVPAPHYYVAPPPAYYVPPPVVYGSPGVSIGFTFR
jgi:hypothetical protein